MAGLLDALFRNESGRRNIANTTQGTSSGPAQGYFQITTGTWDDFGGRQYAPDPLHASYEQQAAIASKIPLKRWDESTVALMRATGKPIDPNRTLGENLSANGESILGASPNAGDKAPGIATPATSTGSAPAGTTLVNPTTNEAAPYSLGETLAPAVVVTAPQQPVFPDKETNPWSGLAAGLANAITDKPQFLSGRGDDGSAMPPLPELAAAAPIPNVDLPDIAAAMPAGADGSALGDLFRSATTIGKAGESKYDEYGRRITPRQYG